MDLVVGASNDAVKSLVNKLGSLLAQEYTLIGGVSDDIQYINDELASMQAFLNRLQREAGGRNEQRQDWMKQVREVAYDIEDCIDNVGRRLRGEPRGRGWLVSLKKAWYLLATLYARHNIATDIGNLKARAQHVSERRTRYGVENPAEVDDGSDGGNALRDRPAPPPQLIGTMEPVGIEDAVTELEPWFTVATSQQHAQHQTRFLAIVGFGGLGKTTLAMALYRKFGHEFDCRATVLASQKFHLRRVLRSLVTKFHGQQSGASKNDLDGIEEWGEEMLKKKLADQLKEKRYLILIDDIWSVSAWDNLRDSLPENKKGGTVVLTTRFKSVSEACRRHNGDVYEHKPLTEGSSNKLFHETISSASYDLCVTRPVNKLVNIMKICGGLPLAVVVVAGLMASKLKSEPNSDLDALLEKLNQELSAVLGNNLTTEGVTQILNYCYKNLPPDLKTCLLYMSMFPKGSLISRKRLIRRWITEGLITEKHGRTVEEIAEDCFNELISRNLIRVVNNSSNGKVKSCLVHDMVLEYIVAKSSDENFITVVGGHWQTPFPSYKVRRLSIHRSDQQEKEIVERMKLSHVRSLTALESFRALHSTMHKLQILQVLDLEGCKDLSLNQLKKICNLHQLKHLSLRQTGIEEIPSNIGRLEYLEVFDVRDTNVRKLPASVERLQRMTHLLAGNKSKRRALKLTQGITKITALQTLSGVEIHGSSGGASKRRPTVGKTTSAQAANTNLAKEQHSFADMENLTNLKKLTIYRLVCFTDSDNELLLSAIEHLSSCSLKFFSIDDNFCGFLDSSLNASEAPPEHLQTLGLCGKLSQVPKWIDRLHNLEKLTLSLTSLTTSTLVVLGELPELFSVTFTLDSEQNTSALKILHNNAMESEGSIFVTAGGFKKLKLLRFMAPVLPPLSFLEGAMSELQRLELRFVMTEGLYGLENLISLRQVVLTVSSQVLEGAKAKVSQIKELARMIPNEPRVVVEEYNESS
ncbi:hypothetical protein EJB05_26858, partial [Eragrostis curvula]